MSNPINIETAYGSNAIRLSQAQWCVALLVVAGVFFGMPFLLRKSAPPPVSLDGRIPYVAGNDYWMYARLTEALARTDRIPVIGDSVMWGHFVPPEHTLSGFLNQELGSAHFANAAIDGIHPVAMEGLLRYYGKALSGKKIILHCNPLWMSSKKHDLQTTKEFSFNHPRLVPQFTPAIPCYRETLSERLAIVVGRSFDFYSWVRHMRLRYYEGLPLQNWTLKHPKDNPFVFPKEVAQDDTSGFSDHSWAEKGIPVFNPEWVELPTSFQWRFFRRSVELLRTRQNQVFVVVGPFNEHMLGEASRRQYVQRVREIEQWLKENQVPYWIPPALSSELYGDASHPVTAGYKHLAEELVKQKAFQQFVNRENNK